MGEFYSQQWFGTKTLGSKLGRGLIFLTFNQKGKYWETKELYRGKFGFFRVFEGGVIYLAAIFNY